MVVFHTSAETSAFICAPVSGGSTRLIFAPFSAAALYSLASTSTPLGVTSVARQFFVSSRRSGYSYPWKSMNREPSGSTSAAQWS